MWRRVVRVENSESKQDGVKGKREAFGRAIEGDCQGPGSGRIVPKVRKYYFGKVSG